MSRRGSNSSIVWDDGDELKLPSIFGSGSGSNSRASSPVPLPPIRRHSIDVSSFVNSVTSSNSTLPAFWNSRSASRSQSPRLSRCESMDGESEENDHINDGNCDGSSSSINKNGSSSARFTPEPLSSAASSPGVRRRLSHFAPSELHEQPVRLQPRPPSTPPQTSSGGSSPRPHTASLSRARRALKKKQAEPPIIDLVNTIRRASFEQLPELKQHFGSRPRWQPEDPTDEIIRKVCISERERGRGDIDRRKVRTEERESVCVFVCVSHTHKQTHPNCHMFAQGTGDQSGVRVFQYLNLPKELIDEDTITQASRERCVCVCVSMFAL